MQGSFLAVKPIKVSHPFLHALVLLVFQQVPVQAVVVVPLSPMPELAAHEEQLLAGLGVHVTKEQSQVGKLLPAVTRHLAEKRLFHVDNIVVRERQDEVLGESGKIAEGK